MKYTLSCDYTGPASGIKYGKKGDTVTLIKQDGNMALVDNGKELFHIQLGKLTANTEASPGAEVKHTVETAGALKQKALPGKQTELF